MSLLAWLVPMALGMGLVGLLAFLWSMKSGQFEDLDGRSASGSGVDRKEKAMGETADRKFDWVARLALASGAAVMVPSLAVLAITLIAVIAAFL